MFPKFYLALLLTSLLNEYSCSTDEFVRAELKTTQDTYWTLMLLL